MTHTSARSSSDCQTTTASQLTGSLQVGVGVGGWKEKGKKKKHTTSAGSEALRTVYCTQYRLSESQQCKKHIVRGGELKPVQVQTNPVPELHYVIEHVFTLAFAGTLAFIRIHFTGKIISQPFSNPTQKKKKSSCSLQ